MLFYIFRLQSLELENSSLREEAARCRAQADKLRLEVQRLEEEQGRSEASVVALKEELEILREKERSNSEASLANQQVSCELQFGITWRCSGSSANPFSLTLVRTFIT